jgi:hypothetical protein
MSSTPEPPATESSAGDHGSNERQPETLWKLTDAKCAQLKDAIRGAQYPFFLALLWGFVWMVALYNHELGYTNAAIRKYEKLISEAYDIKSKGKSATPYRDALANTTIGRHHADVKNLPEDVCEKILQTQHERLLCQQVDYWNVKLPGLIARVTVFDMDIVGLVGLLIIFLWFFYAARRENHAIRSFVYFAEEAARNKWFPQRFTLVPQNAHLGPEHYAYAYQGVAHRFLFLFSSISGPLLVMTIILISFPLLIALWNYGTDLRDFCKFDLETQVGIRVVIQSVLTACVFILTIGIIRKQVETSVLLNSWSLANRDVWEASWDETVTRPAQNVTIDREIQKAYPVNAGATTPAQTSSGQ